MLTRDHSKGLDLVRRTNLQADLDFSETLERSRRTLLITCAALVIQMVYRVMKARMVIKERRAEIAAAAAEKAALAVEATAVRQREGLERKVSILESS